jgi:hypothetical protein
VGERGKAEKGDGCNCFSEVKRVKKCKQKTIEKITYT